ncbi:MAG: phosphoserine phosphatase SerB [Pelagibacterales bacterium]|nr:phosphoserine phosphatase SerB [Pelagibacterales bacterium]OUU61854.1 MAG: phosphoserine phosphatase SerB [Alphaproteobacteria bacterium TMED62]|tara:strand:- start:5857 stop:6759 length:903 start_codon:yes stop_codon:yes gene_type:complete
MIHKHYPFVLTLVAINKNTFNECYVSIQNIFIERNITIRYVKKLSRYVVDIYFNCQPTEYDNMKNNIYLLKNKADLLIQKVENRKKHLLACDMDMTIINVETINLINDNLLKNSEVSNITEKAMSGNINFKDSIIARTKLLKGINKKDILKLIKNITINKGVRSVIKTMNKYGYHTMLISGGYDIIAETIGKKIGFKEVKSNSLEIINNKLSGNIKSTILDKKGKLFHIKNTIKKYNIKKEMTIAVGDGDNDLEMIKFAGLGIGWNAYPKVKKIADTSIGQRFKSILYFQGYSDKDIISN